MKKIFVTIISVLAIFAACTKIEDSTFRNINSVKNEIYFSTDSRSTKAIVEGTTLVDNFGVYGYVIPGDFAPVGGYLMKNAEYDPAGDAVSGSYYWPNSDNNTGIDFLFTAYSQFESAPTWENDTLKLVVPTLTQALIDDPAGLDDILWTQTKYTHHQKSTAEHERVNLNFKHALSWLQFRGEVINPNIKWVKVKQINFGDWDEGQAAVYDTTRYYNVANQYNLFPGGFWKNGAPLTSAQIDYINSFYELCDVDGNPVVWSDVTVEGNHTVCKLVTKNEDRIPDEYKREIPGVGVFFDTNKYLVDVCGVRGTNYPPSNPSSTGWVFNGSFYAADPWLIVHFDSDININKCVYEVNLTSDFYYNTTTWTNNDANEHKGTQLGLIEELVTTTPAIPAHSSEGLYVDGILCLPTKDTLTTTPLAVYGTQKDTTLNYVKTQVDTIFTNDHIILGNSLVVPQPVPEKITVVFDICIANPGGDDVVFTDRKITRTINTGKDMVDVDYVASWIASNKYIYNFKFDGDTLDFSTSVLGWTVDDHDYHVWKY